MADRFPQTPIILDHLGLAVQIGLNEQGRAETFEVWRKALGDLAQRPNVNCKISGLGLPYWGFGFNERGDVVGSPELASAWRPYVEVAMNAFGADRCVMASDFPPDGASCGFVPMWNALKLTVVGCSAEEKRKLFKENAARIYRIEI